MNQLTQYIIALSNLYGMVHKDKVVEIYNNQNKDQIILAQVEMLIKIPSEALEDSFIEVYNDYFVHEDIINNGEFDLILRQKGAKPYYVPKKNELLKYVDEDYFEKTKPYNALIKYVKKNFFEGDEEKAEELCENIQEFVQFGLDIQTILDFVTNQIENFNNVNQVNDIMQLVMELSNHTRIWENNGHTPYEIYEKFEKQNLRPLPDKQFDYNQTNVIDMKTKEKIGRNDPCPCGSGKKFKKCCLLKVEDVNS